MKRIIIIFCLFLTSFYPTYAQDSLENKPKWYNSGLANSLKVPLTLTAIGIYIHQEDAVINRFEIKQELRENDSDFNTSVDDYLRYVPPAAVFAMDAFGMKGKNKPGRQALLFVKANTVAIALAFPLKGITKVRRPDDSSSASMPSLHTAQAFLGATFLHKEYGHISPWISVGGYAIATTTGYLRIMNNKHWASDVLVGAAVGIFSTHLAYLTQSKKRKEKKTALNKMIITPTYNGGPGVAMVVEL